MLLRFSVCGWGWGCGSSAAINQSNVNMILFFCCFFKFFPPLEIFRLFFFSGRKMNKIQKLFSNSSFEHGTWPPISRLPIPLHFSLQILSSSVGAPHSFYISFSDSCISLLFLLFLLR